MVTRPVAKRREMRARAIRHYLRQDYADRELVIVIDRGDEAERESILQSIEALGRSDVRVILAEGAPTLGMLRNITVGAAHGELICQWDDDDFHHPCRIAQQYEALSDSGREAVILGDVMMLDTPRGRLVWLNWARTPAGGHPATLLCRREAMPAYPEDGPAARRGEDLAVTHALKDRGRLAIQAGAPHLYVYVAHGSNTSPDNHQAMLMATLAISKGLLSRREDFLRERLAAFEDLATVSVEGTNGSVFSL